MSGIDLLDGLTLPEVATDGSAETGDGAATAACVAVRPGSVTVCTMTGPFAGDRHGPLQRHWQLAVEVCG